MLAGWVFVLVGGVTAGAVTADMIFRSAERQRAESRLVTAVLVEDAPERRASRVVTDARVEAKARWTAPDGSTRAGEVRVTPLTPAGSPVRVWTDGDGTQTSEPLSAGEVRLHSVAGGVLLGAGAGGTVLGIVWAVRRRLDRRRMAQWAAEWERIDTWPGWRPG